MAHVQLISPFLDPVTRAKIVFISTSSEEQRVEQLSQMVASSAVDACADNRPEVDVEGYAKRMRQLDAERRQQYNAFCTAAAKSAKLDFSAAESRHSDAEA